MRRVGLLIAIPVAAATLLTGCGGSRKVGVAHRPARSTRAPCRVEAAVRATPSRSYAVLIRTSAAIRSEPQAGRLLVRVKQRDVNGFRTVLGVLGARRAAGPCRPAAYRVQLPVTANMRSGWISARAVRVFGVETHIVVDLSERRLVAYRDGRQALRVRVTIGAPQTPTPVGRYFVNERWLLLNPGGPFGVAALGISAHSTVLHDWVQHGPIGIHGTNDPGAIGHAASNGCVRLRNADMRKLLRLAPAGTPVTIRR